MATPSSAIGQFVIGQSRVGPQTLSGASITIDSIPVHASNESFIISGSLAGFAHFWMLEWSDDGTNIWTEFDGSGPTFSFTHAPMAAGTHTVTIRSTESHGVLRTSNQFAITGAVPTPTITVSSIGPQAANVAFSISGSLTNFQTQSPLLEWSDDATNTWTRFNGVGTSFSFNHPGMAAGNHTVTVRDAGTTSIAGVSNQFNVASAPAQPAITIATIGPQTTNANFVITGSLANFPNSPNLEWSDDALNVWTGFAALGATFSFNHPGMAAGTHTVSVRDPSNISVIGISNPFAVATIAPVGPPTYVWQSDRKPGPTDRVIIDRGIALGANLRSVILFQ